MKKSLSKKLSKKLNISPNDPRFVKIGQAAKTLGVSIDTLRRWERSGKIQALRTVGQTRLYSFDELEKINPKAFPANPPSTEELLKKIDPSVILNEAKRSEESLSLSEKDLKQIQRSFADAQDDIAKSSKIYANSNFFKNTYAKIYATVIITAVSLISYNLTGQILENQKQPMFNPASKNVLPAARLPAGQGRQVLAETTAQKYLEINADSQIIGNLSVSDTINNLVIEASPSASTFRLISGNTILDISGVTTLDQDLSSLSSPTFTSVNLSDTSNQLIFASGGTEGTLTWTPTAARTITIPDATTTLVGTNTTQTLTNKTISGSSNTLSSIPNSALSNSKVTVSPGTNLSGGGDISLGGSATLSLKDSISLSGTLAVSGATTLSSTLAVTGTSSFTGNVGIGTSTAPSTLSLGVSGNVGIGASYATLSAPSNGLAVEGNVGIGTTTAKSTLSVSGNAHIGSIRQGASAPTDGLLVDGNVGIGGTSAGYNLDVWGNGRFTQGLTLGGNLDIGSSLNVSGLIFAQGGLRVNGFSDLTGNVGIGGSLSVSHISPNTGNLGIGGSLNVTSASVLSSLSVPGHSSLSTLSTSGASTFNGGLTISGVPLDITTGTDETLTIIPNGTGNVGVGTSNTYGRLHLLGSGTGTGIVLQTASLTRSQGLTVLDNGNVGVGFTTPDYNLRVQGSGYFSGFVGLGSSLSVSGNVGIGGSLTSSLISPSAGNLGIGGSLQIGNLAFAQSGLRVNGFSDLTGNVGIGGSLSVSHISPNTGNLGIGGSLNVASAAVLSSLQVNGHSSLSTLSTSGASTFNGGLTISGVPLDITTGTDETLTIIPNGTGNVGVGTSNTYGRLHLLGSGTGTGIVLQTASLTRSQGLTVLDNGNVGVGFTTPDYNLRVQGSGYFSGFVGLGSSLSVSGNVGIGGSLTSSLISPSAGNLGIGGSLQIGNLAFAQAGLRVNGFSDLTGNVGIGGSLAVSLISPNTGNLGIGGSLNVASAAVLSSLQVNGHSSLSTLSTSGASTFNGGLTISGVPLDITTGTDETLTIIPNGTGNVGVGTSNTYGRLHLLGSGTGTGIVLQTASLTRSQGLTVLDNGNVGVGFTTPDYNLRVQGSGYFSGFVGLGSSLSVSGNVGIGGSLTSSLISPSAGNLGIGGSLQIGNLTFAQAGLRVNGFSDLTGNVGIGSSLNVTSASILDSLAVTKSISAATLGTTGNVALGSSLTVSSAGVFNSSLSVSGHSSLSTLSTSGASTFNGGLTISGVPLDITTGTDETLTIIPNGTGNVGVGTSNTYGRLHLLGAGTGTGIVLQTVSLTRSQGLTVLDNGNVGVGFTTPDYNLRVQGSGYFSGFVGLGSSLSVSGNVGIGGSLTSSLISPSAGNLGIGGSLQIGNLTFAQAGLRVNGFSDLTGNVGIGSSLNVTSASILDSLAVTKSISAATLGTTGNVALGSSLTVSSAGVFNSSLSVSGHSSLSTLSTSGASTFNGGLTISGVPLDITTGTDETLTIIPNGTGNVGVGTSNTYGRLHLLGSGTGTGIALQTVSSTQAQGLTVLDNGNVGVGFTTPDYNLRVQGTGYFNGFVGIGSSLSVTGNVGIGGSLTTTLISPSAGNLGIGGSLQIGNLTFAQAGLRVNGFSDLTGNVGIGSSLNVTSASILDSLAVTKSISAATLGTTGNVALGSSLTVSSAGVFNSSLSVSGHSSLSTLSTSGASTFNGGLTFSGVASDITTGTNETLTIIPNGTGNVGVGTSNTYGRLHLLGAGTGTGIVLQTASLTRSQGLTVLDNGNVGVGFTTPDYNLRVQGSGYFSGFVGLGSSLSVTGNVGIGGSLTTTLISPSSGNLGIGGSLQIGNLTFAQAGLRVNGFSDLTGNVGIGGSLAVSLISPNTGNLGIGGSLNVTSASVLSSLSVPGHSSLNTLSTSGASTFNGGLTISGVPLDITTGTDETLTIIPNGTGNVGVGTSNTYGRLFLLGSGGGTGIALQTVSSTQAQGLTVLDNGNVGVGFTTPDYNLRVQGTGYFNGFVGLGSSLSVSGNVGIGGSLTSSLISPSSGNLGIGGSLQIGNLAFAQAGLRVNGFSDLTGNVGIGGSLSVSHISPNTGNLGIGGSLNVTSASVLSSLQVNGVSSLGIVSTGVINANGLITANAGLTVPSGQTLTVAGTLDSNGDVSIADTDIAFDGASTTFTVTGALSVNTGGTITIGDGGDGITLNAAGTVTINDANVSFINQATDLDIIDNTASSLTISQSTNDYLNINTANNAENITFGNSTTNPRFIFTGGNLGISNTAPGATLLVGGNANIGYTGYISDPLGLSVRGNVGIGTSTTNNALTVAGNGSIGAGYANSTAPANGLLIQGNVGIGSTGLGSSSNGTFNLDVWGTGRFTGNLGLGASLTVSSTGAFRLSGQDCSSLGSGGKLTTDANGNVFCSADSGGASGSGANGQVTFWTAASAQSGANTLFWDNTNLRIGIGSSAPGATLGVFGAAGIGSSYGFATLPASMVNGLAVQGNVGIGQSSTNTTLSVAGNVAIGWTGGNLSPNIPGLGLSVFGNTGLGTTSPSGALHVVGQCVAWDTKIRVRRRRRRNLELGTGNLDDEEYDYLEVMIQDIKIGDEVLSLNETTEEFEYQRVNKLMDMGRKGVYEITTSSGRTIKTTAEHPYLTRLTSKESRPTFEVLYSSPIKDAGWIKVTNLKVGDMIAIADIKSEHT